MEDSLLQRGAEKCITEKGTGLIFLFLDDGSGLCMLIMNTWGGKVDDAGDGRTTE